MCTYTYIIKQLGSQELGSQSERGGQAKRGRYMLMSKEQAVLSMFPVLSATRANDSDVISLHPLYFSSDTRVVCNWVYHNSKWEKEQSNGRDEFRIYFPHELDNKNMFARDLVIFRKTSLTEDCRDYYFQWLTPDKVEYSLALECFKAHRLAKKNYAVYDGYLDFFENELKHFGKLNRNSNDRFNQENTYEEIESEPSVIIDPNVLNRIENQSSMRGFENLFRDQSSFREFVITSYNKTCAVTQDCLTYKEFTNVEAAHIQPRAHNGPYFPTNGIAMRRDIHWAFDKGFFTLGDDLEIIVHPEILPLNNYLCKYHNKRLARVSFGPFSPEMCFVEHHRNHIYGLFLKQGVISPLT